MMTVCILAMCREPKLLAATLMVFKTVRVGFPTARIEVTIPDHSKCQEEIYKAAVGVGAEIVPWTDERFIHPRWIPGCIVRHTGPIAIIDTDMVFWENCEGFTFGGLWAGYAVPEFMDPFTNCVTLPRLHTSFLWIPDCQRLWDRTMKIYPEETFLSPMNLFAPFVYHHHGQRYFQDTTGALYQAIGGDKFSKETLACYDHLNCGTFTDLVAERVPDGASWQDRYEQAMADPSTIRNSWPMYEQYYERLKYGRTR